MRQKHICAVRSKLEKKDFKLGRCTGSSVSHGKSVLYGYLTKLQTGECTSRDAKVFNGSLPFASYGVYSDFG